MTLTATDASEEQPTLGFFGLGLRGQPMALNLARSGARLTVWNRSPGKCAPLHEAGAAVVVSPGEVFARARVVSVMMVDEAATDAVLARAKPSFAYMVAARIVVCMGSNSRAYSRDLAADIAAAGGRYVEAPVSGSRKPAEAGQLVALLGGDAEAMEQVAPLLRPMYREAVRCGAVGSGLLMKLSVNLFLNQTLAALAEAVHFAGSNGIDLRAFQAAVDAGPMACDVTRVKIPKLVARDFGAQAAMTDALNSEHLITQAARAIGIATPMFDAGTRLFAEAVERGDEGLDMVAVHGVLEAQGRC